jgi:hypothetical protein
MLVVRIWQNINPIDLLTTLKTLIMIKIDEIKNSFKKVKIMKFIKSIVLGVALVG